MKPLHSESSAKQPSRNPGQEPVAQGLSHAATNPAENSAQLPIQPNPPEKRASPNFTQLAALLAFAVILWLSQHNAAAQENEFSAQLTPDGQAVTIFNGNYQAQVPLAELALLLDQHQQPAPDLRATPVSTPELRATPTPLPTPENFRLGALEFDKRSPITITLSHPGLQHTAVVEPVIFRDDFTPEQLETFLREDFNPGAHTIAVDDIEGGHFQLFAHSGWWQQRERLMAEPIRFWLEGGLYGPTDRRLPPEESQARLQNLLGEVVSFEQEGRQESFEVVAATFVPEAQVAIVERDTHTLLRALQRVTTAEDEQGNPTSPYDTYVEELDRIRRVQWLASNRWFSLLSGKEAPVSSIQGPLPSALPNQNSSENSGQAKARLVLLTFCGWADTADQADWATATRYIIALRQTNESN
jgi:hypothetical protein